jgi:hypothetical protein
MKILAAFATGLFAASLLSAQTQPVANATGPAPTVAKDKKTADDTAKTPTTPPVKKDVKKPEPEPKILGTTIARPNGTFLGLEVVGGIFKLSFYDAKKKPVAPDVTRASARWPNRRTTLGEDRTVLNPGDKALVGSKPVLPPYTFIVRLTLLQGEGDEAKVVENYTVQLQG